jgi:hypothetical protein
MKVKKDAVTLSGALFVPSSSFFFARGGGCLFFVINFTIYKYHFFFQKITPRIIRKDVLPEIK